MTIKLTFLGGASSIGASCAILEAAGKCFLIDCGVRFDPKAPLPHLDALEGKSIDAIFVTHAHSDHTGGLPLAHAAAPGAPIYMTPPTVDLIRVLFKDALKLMGSSERETELPLYRKQDVEDLFCAIKPVSWNEVLEIGDIEIRYFAASHILGASMIHFSTPSGNVLFTGDFSVTSQLTVDGLSVPDLPVDILVTESTYGNRLHSDRKVTEALFVQKVGEIIARGGKVLIPSFALGRAQEIILILKHAIRKHDLPDIPVYVDGMVRHMCGVYSSHPDYLHPRLAKAAHHERNLFFSDLIQPIGFERDARQNALENGPCVIVASSGMLTGGPSTFYASKLAPYAENGILLSGYQDEESPGRALLNLANASTEGERFLPLPQGRVPLKCDIGSYSLSAHADSQQILRLAEQLSAKTLILVHGDNEAKASLVKKTSCRDVILGTEGTVIERKYPARKVREGKGRTLDFDRNMAVEATGEKKLKAFLEENLLPQHTTSCSESPENTHSCRMSIDFFDTVVEALCTEKSTQEARNAASLALIEKIKNELLPDILVTPKRVRLFLKDEETLKSLNPKGRLLELFNSLKIGEMPALKSYSYGPAHEQIVVSQGSIRWQGTSLKSKIYVYRKEKPIEAAICQEFYSLLKDTQPQQKISKSSGSQTTYSAADSVSDENTLPPNSRMWLNEARASKKLKDFSYTLVEQSGPSHNPTFVMTGELLFPDNSSKIVGPFRANTKKNSEILCANAMAMLLIEAHKNGSGRDKKPN